MMINIAANMIERGLNGVYFTLELNQLIIYERFLKRLGKLTDDQIEKLALSPESMNIVSKMMSQYGRLDVVKYPSKGATTLDLENKLLRLDFIPDFIVVDYLAELRPLLRGDNKRDMLADIGRDLRSLGDRMGFPVITAQQGNRESQKQMELSSEDSGKRLLTGSFSIAECYELIGIADVIFTINQDEEDLKQEVFRGWISESRIGASKGNPILYSVSYEKQLIREIDAGFGMGDKISTIQEETITV